MNSWVRWTILSLGWLILSTVGSIGFRILTNVSESALTDADLGGLTTLGDPGMFDRGAARSLAIVIVVAITLLALLTVVGLRETEAAQCD